MMRRRRMVSRTIKGKRGRETKNETGKGDANAKDRRKKTEKDK